MNRMASVIVNRVRQAVSFFLDSSTSATADTTRLRIRSYQKQEVENNNRGGEVAHFDLGSPLAKAMLTWRLPLPPDSRTPYAVGHEAPDSRYKAVTWEGAHWFAQNQDDDANPTDIHGHWSVEVPDSTLTMHTRFAIDFYDRDTDEVGIDVTDIYTNRANLVFSASQGGVVKITGTEDIEKRVEWFRDFRGTNPAAIRWVQAMTTESVGVGSDYVLRRYDSSGVLVEDSLLVRRATGTVEVARDVEVTDSDHGVILQSPDGTRYRVTVANGGTLTTTAL